MTGFWRVGLSLCGRDERFKSKIEPPFRSFVACRADYFVGVSSGWLLLS